MGKGKGSVEEWVMNIKPGRVIFEVAGVPEDIARSALTLALHKFPLKCELSLQRIVMKYTGLPIKC